MQFKRFCSVFGLSLFALGAQAAVVSDVIQCAITAPITLPEGGAPGSEFVPNFCSIGFPVVGVVLLTEPGTGIVSDQLWANGGPSFSFASDPDLQDLTGLPILGTFDETGTPQDFSTLFFAVPPGFIVVTSDVVTDAGPEPATILFAAPALLLLGFRRLRTS